MLGGNAVTEGLHNGKDAGKTLWPEIFYICQRMRKPNSLRNQNKKIFLVVKILIITIIIIHKVSVKY